jgi:hypothetical protein
MLPPCPFTLAKPEWGMSPGARQAVSMPRKLAQNSRLGGAIQPRDFGASSAVRMRHRASSGGHQAQTPGRTESAQANERQPGPWPSSWQ